MSSMDLYRDSITSYYLENLPEALLGAFIPQEKIPLTPGMMQAFAYMLGVPGEERSSETESQLAELASCIQASLGAVDRKAFIRLGSRSPKDSLCKSLPCGSAGDALDMLMFSKRIFDDVHWAYLYEYPVSLFIRPWLAIQEWQEFRCLIKNSALYGISQYYSDGRMSYQNICDKYKEMAYNISTFIIHHVLPHAIHDNYVCDVIYDKDCIHIVDYNPLIGNTGLSFFEPNFPAPDAQEFRFWSDNGLKIFKL